MAESSTPRAWLHVYLLAAVAIALPLFDVLADSPDFFVAQAAGPLEILLLTLLFGVGLPAALAAAVHRLPMLAPALVGLLAGLYALRVLGTALSGSVLASIAGAAALAVVVGVGYRRWPGLRSFLSLLSPIALALPLWFVLGSPVAALVLPGAQQASSAGAHVARLPIVFVVVDELPTVSLLGADGLIDATRFPSFARLADEASWFRRASSVADFTTGSVTALLSGRYADDETLPHYKTETETLYSLLRDAYTFNVWERITHLLPPELHAGAARHQAGFLGRFVPLLADSAVVWSHAVAPRVLRDALPGIGSAWTGLAGLERRAAGERESGERWQHALAGERIDFFNDFVESIEASTNDRGVVHFLHVMLPHVPWVHLPSGRLHEPLGFGERLLLLNAEAQQVQAEGPESRMVLWHQRHLLQTAAVDRMLGRLLDRLEELKLYDEALIIVTADHGRSFKVGSAPRTPGAGNEAEILLVPLLLKVPGQRRGIVHDVDAQLVDVVPSIADVLGVQIPWAVDGSSLFGELPPRPARRFFSRKTARRAYPTRQLLRSQSDALRRNVRRFSLGRADSDLFRFGPWRQLVGQRLEDVPSLGPALDFELRDGAKTFTVAEDDEGSALVPAHLMGWLSESAPRQPDAVVVSIDGIIGATPRVERLRGRDRFEAFLPESLLGPGEHRLSVHALAAGS